MSQMYYMNEKERTIIKVTTNSDGTTEESYEKVPDSMYIPKIADSKFNVISMLLNFDGQKIPYTLDFRPNESLKFVLSATDKEGNDHSVANSDLAEALMEVFDLVKERYLV